MSPLCTPTDIRRGTRPHDVGILARLSQSAARISTAALAGLDARDRRPWNRKRSASPPNFSRWPPRSVAERDHRAEDPVQDLGELLGSDPPVRRQPLGEVGEAGDVGEHQRAVDLLVPPPGRVSIPLGREGRHESDRRSVACGLVKGGAYRSASGIAGPLRRPR